MDDSGRRILLSYACLAIGLAASAAAQNHRIDTVAGGGPVGGPALSTPMGDPSGAAFDAAANLYVCARRLNRVYVITPSGALQILAGDGGSGFGGDGGPAVEASLTYPSGVLVDASGNVWIADTNNHRVRRIERSTGVITTIAGTGEAATTGDGGMATDGAVYKPVSLAFAANKDLLIVSDGFFGSVIGNVVRRVSSTGVITTIAGDGYPEFTGDGGPATAARLNSPAGIAVNSSGDIFIADQYNNRVRRIDATTNVITTVAGNGQASPSGDGGAATAAGLGHVLGVAFDLTGDLLIATEWRIRRVDSAGIIHTVAGDGLGGDGGPALTAAVGPTSVTADQDGNIVLTERTHRVRRIVAATGLISTFAGNGTAGFSGDGGPANQASLFFPSDAASDAGGNLFVADAFNERVRRVDAVTGVMTTLAGTGASGFNGDGRPAVSARLDTPLGVAVDRLGNVFIAEFNGQRIRRVDGRTGLIATVAGNGVYGYGGDGGPATQASLAAPAAVAVDGAGNLFVSDSGNHRVRRVDAASGTIQTMAGNGVPGWTGDGGPATQASLQSPGCVAVGDNGDLYIADSENGRVRRVDSSNGTIETFAVVPCPTGVALDGAGSLLVAEACRHQAYRFDLVTRTATLLAGTGAAGFDGDGGLATAASLTTPYRVAAGLGAILYVADANNERIRRLKLPAPPGKLFTVEPCRLADTRSAEAPPLVARTARAFQVAGRCGIPATARAVAVSVAVTGADAAGNLLLYAGGVAPVSSTINYVAGQTRANNAVVTLSDIGTVVVRSNQPTGTVQVILDVAGYFE